MNTFKELKSVLKKDLMGLPSIKVSLVGDTATQFLATSIRGEGALRGYNIDMFEADYNQVEQQVMDPTSDLYEHNANIFFFNETKKKKFWCYLGTFVMVLLCVWMRKECVGCKDTA